MKFHTRELSGGSLIISASDGVQQVSIQANTTSSCTVTGGIIFQQVASQPLTLTDGEGLTVSAQSPASPIDGFTITWLSGTIDVIIGL